MRSKPLQPTRHPRLLPALCAIAAVLLPAGAHADTALADPAHPADQHLYAGQYDLATNLWGIRDAGSAWAVGLFTHAPSSMDGAGYTWSGVGGSSDSVKAYASVRYGASNQHNVPGESGLPYLLGDNQRNINVAWDFTADSIDGKYNHTLDIFFNASASMKQTEIRGEIMIITESSQDARTHGWGARDSRPFLIGPETWYVWQATQTSHGHSWHVTQFRKRVDSRSFHHNLKDFFAEAATRRPDIFGPANYVMMVEAGTEIKTGAGRVVLDRYRVKVD
ncbi:glycoside hydrolase family 12 protein [Janthinobacterium aquaticum]|uniref:hypothetical protein n=1 Tax=Janthinobacterium sp. FT58W TaxID=2654254 RepID=UPI001264E610|nr:hypothetical protein [Janthinobacterium sp. FT58W]KAB8042281.1 hypothetical protein GCM43_14525 [Janthinobacterium sp. FT58W]